MQNTQKHTQGPWHFDGKTVSAKGQPNVCRLENGHLIAAAPDLLAAAEALVEFADGNNRLNLTGKLAESVGLARAALAKAEGIK